MEMYTFWEADSYTAMQELPEGSLTRSQGSSSIPYREPDQSTLYHPILPP
jgi:hypothetical protein